MVLAKSPQCLNFNNYYTFNLKVVVVHEFGRLNTTGDEMRFLKFQSLPDTVLISGCCPSSWAGS